MRNGGSPLAHLSLSSLSDPSGWLQYKWSQLPPRAPDWVFDNFQKFNHEMATTAAMVAEKAIAQLAATLAETA
jgi:hypothetical protein